MRDNIIKKICIITCLALLFSTAVLAATNDFTANGDITISGVTFGTGTTDMIIFNGSTAESWQFNNGTFTVTNPGTFKVGSADSGVKSFRILLNGSTVACDENVSPGVSYTTLPTNPGTYTIQPSSVSDCTDLCTSITGALTYNDYPICGAASCATGYILVGSGSSAGCCPTVEHALSYNSYPTCGAASCESGYALSGSGSSAICVAVSSGSSAPLPQNIQTTYQIYDPKTGELIEGSLEENVKKSKTTQPATKTVVNKYDEQWNQIINEGELIYDGDVNKVLNEMGLKRDLSREAENRLKYVKPIIKNMEADAATVNAITNFITYGTKSTLFLGMGERAGVVNSYKSAFGKLPRTKEEWRDCIAIANGRWPTERNEVTEKNAIKAFKKIYLREPDRSNPHDDAAVVIMAYGLRSQKRDLNKEKFAIKIFRAIYGYNPFSSEAWDIVRAIAYSGATR